MTPRSDEEINAMILAIQVEWKSLGNEDEYGDSTQPRKKLLREWRGDLRLFLRNKPTRDPDVRLWLEGRPSRLDDIEVQ